MQHNSDVDFGKRRNQDESQATKRKGPKMLRVSEETKQLSAMLGTELSTWPRVTTRPMFGLRGFYRGKKIFAALPVTAHHQESKLVQSSESSLCQRNSWSGLRKNRASIPKMPAQRENGSPSC